MVIVILFLKIDVSTYVFTLRPDIYAYSLYRITASLFIITISPIYTVKNAPLEMGRITFEHALTFIRLAGEEGGSAEIDQLINTLTTVRNPLNSTAVRDALTEAVLEAKRLKLRAPEKKAAVAEGRDSSTEATPPAVDDSDDTTPPEDLAALIFCELLITFHGRSEKGVNRIRRFGYSNNVVVGKGMLISIV